MSAVVHILRGVGFLFVFVLDAEIFLVHKLKKKPGKKVNTQSLTRVVHNLK